ncbi:TapB family protein [Arenibacter algicola]|uniref:DUF3108 domain-containing protein n=1 Tax=Arenibacter algicola TaxID=616991 RepID=A0A221URW1_9FLAO|nr:hypothetical protein [Arenibacter algicola]ASO03983.1 hypothetical protein AREALGSMS7_00494 [Arenibacter algicola]
MRTLILIYSLFLVSSTALSQNCSKYYPMEEGTSFQYTMTNKKGKTEGITDYSITNVENTGGVTTASMNMKFTDEKGKEIFVSDYKLSCTGDVVKIDYNSLVPAQMMKQYTDMGVEMEISGTDIELPNNLSVGQGLDDANVAISIKMTGMNMNIKVDQLNRIVEKKESVTTPAGTYECYVITQDNVSETMGVKQTMQSKLWLAEGVGMVKQETYNKKGDLMSKSELTSFKK